MQAAARNFFKSPHFAVVGASQDRSKFGFRSNCLPLNYDMEYELTCLAVLAWYHMHSLPVTPINPSTLSIKLSTNPNASYATVPSVSQLSDPSSTALSFLTPPSITAKVLTEAQKAGVKSIWLQPGSFDDKILEDAKKVFENVVGGYEDGTVGGEGWCVLVDGENLLDDVRRTWKQQRL